MDQGAAEVNLEFTDKADADLGEIWVYNADRYSVEHADKYRAFLLVELETLREQPEWGKTVENFPNLRCLVMRWRAGGYGHAAYYEIHSDAVRIVRILHTAMDAPGHIDAQ